MSLVGRWSPWSGLTRTFSTTARDCKAKAKSKGSQGASRGGRRTPVADKNPSHLPRTPLKPALLRHGALLKTPQRRLRLIPKGETSPQETRALQTKVERKLEALRNRIKNGKEDEEANRADLAKFQTMNDRAKATSSRATKEERELAFDRLQIGPEERKTILSRLALKEEAKWSPVYFPSNIVRLVRPPNGTSPFEAHFRVSNSMTQPDLWNYLENIYQLKIKDIRTMNYIAPLKRTIGGMVRERPGRGARTFKKAIVDLVHPFWYPPELTRQQLETKFRKTEYESASRQFLMKLKGWRVRGTHTTKQKLNAETEKRLDRLEMIQKMSNQSRDPAVV